MNEIEFENGSLDDLLGNAQQPENDDPIDDPTPQDSDVPVDNPDLLDDPQENPDDNGDDNPVADSDVITSFLKEFGVENGKITYENENGDTEEVNFNELDSAEQLNILKELTTPNLSEHEIETINFLRKNNVTLQDVVEYYSQVAIQNYIKQNGEPQRDYSIDEYSDDELYFADLKAKYPDMTDEEIQADVDTAKENEELFKKKADAIRKQYKAKEDERVQAIKQQQQDQYTAFDNSIKQSITNFNEVSLDYKDSKADALVIDNNMKNDIYNYLMRVDENGKSQFAKDLEDTNKWVNFAWFALYGNEAISDITNYWKNELKNTRRDTQKPRQTSQTIVKKTDNKPRQIIDHHRNSIEFIGGENLL